MPRTTFHLCLDSHVRRNGERAVYVRATQDKKFIYIHTSVFVKEANFNKDAKNHNWVRTKDIDCGIKNDALKSALGRIQQTYDDALKEGPVSLARLKALLNARDADGSLLNATQRHADKLATLKKASTGTAYYGLLKKLQAYARHKRKKDILFSDVDERFIEDFDLWLHGLDNENAKKTRKLKESTIGMIEKRLRVVISTAPEGSVKGDPFRSITFRRGSTAVKNVLTEEEIALMRDAELDTRTSPARDAFLFSYYAAGMRAGDVLTLRWKNLDGNRLVYAMAKTGKVRSLVLVEQAMEIVDRYRTDGSQPSDFIFPFLDGNSPWAQAWDGAGTEYLSADLANDMKREINNRISAIDHALKTIATAAGIGKKISFHCARHSFSTQMLRSGVDPMIIKSALAHSSLATTQVYLRDFDTAAVDDAVRGVFDKDADERRLKELLAKMPKDKLDALLKGLQ